MISIIITNYNKEKFIKKTLESCLLQTDHNFEIILFDDRSTDNSIKIVKNLLNDFKHINFKLLFREGKKSKYNSFNQMSAIKNCLIHCKGNYVSLLDGDDIFSQDKIRKILNLIKCGKKIIYNSYRILRNNEYINNQRHFKLRKFIWPIFPPTSCLTIEKKLLEELSNKIFIKKYPTCWLDFRVALYASKFHEKEILYKRECLTTYVHDDDSADQAYNRFYTRLFWKRKLEAISFYYDLVQ